MPLTISYDLDRLSDENRRNVLARLQRQTALLLHREIAHLASIGLGRGSLAVDVGCGPGFITGAIADVVAPAETIGIDTNVELLDVARTVVARRHPNLRFLEGSAYETGVAQASCDFVYSRLVYQHLTDPLRALREARRITRPGGRVCVLDVDDGWLSLEPRCDAFDALARLASEAQHRDGGDRFIGRKLPHLMMQAGFRAVQVQVISVSSLEIGLPAFLELTTRLKAMQLDEAVAERLLHDVQASTADGTAVGIVGAFFVTGTT